jgi:hypothetical protein
MGCATKGGGKGKMIKATSKKTGPIMMRGGGYATKKGKGMGAVSPRKRMAMSGCK